MLKPGIGVRMGKGSLGNTRKGNIRMAMGTARAPLRRVGAVLTLAALLLALGVPPLWPQGFGDALVGWWRMDEGSGTAVADSSGLSNDGTLSGGVSFTSDALLGSALDFTAPDGTATIPHHASLEPVKGTIQAWVKVSAAQNADIVAKVTDCLVRTEPCLVPFGRSVIGLRITADGRAIGFVANNDPTTPLAPWRSAISPPDLVTPGEWHHLAMRWNGSEVSIFVNGVLQDSEPYDPVPGTGLSYHGTFPFWLGVATTGGGHFIGQLDDVRFYGRARPDVEIFTDWVTKGHKPAKPPGP